MKGKIIVLSGLTACFLLIAAPGVLCARQDRSGGEDKPVEQVRKNIQVLKGLPASQLNPVMDDMATSLGVRCGHCHSGEGREMQFERDDKPAKRTARKMIQMVMNLNSNSFGGRSAITCYTCHRGSTEPASMMPLPQPPVREEREKPEETSALPDPDHVVAMLENALGGADALKKITSRVTKGVTVGPGGPESPFELLQARPEKMVSRVTAREGMEFVRGFDGTTAWMSSPRGIRVLPPAAANEFKKEAALFPVDRLKQLSATLHVTDKDTVNGSAAYVLASPAGDHITERYYIDTATGLLLRREIVTETMIGDIPEQEDYADYRAVDGVKVPFEIRTAAADPRDNSVRRVSSVEQNVSIDDKKFEQPKN